MIAKNNVIEIPVSKNEMQYLYYKESSLLVNLRYYPVFQLGVILIFIVVAYIAFSSARKSEQNLVWIGLAKETAHQLGTPISSLIAWIELLKDEQVDELTLTELSKDVNKLKKISERFSKIGSKPELYPENIYAILTNTVQYLRTRVSKKIVFKTNFSETDELFVPLSASLFGWVIENIIKNSVDSIEDKKGTITLEVQSNEKEIIIDISDTGRGINKSRFKTIFNPGYTTKQRGWGLGLSLSKRIIEIYHRGKIFIKSSESYKQTTFRIILKIKQKNYE
jgi:signal transduction histidine kinase